MNKFKVGDFVEWYLNNTVGSTWQVVAVYGDSTYDVVCLEDGAYNGLTCNGTVLPNYEKLTEKSLTQTKSTVIQVGDRVRGKTTGRTGTVTNVNIDGAVIAINDAGVSFELSKEHAELVPEDILTTEHVVEWYGHLDEAMAEYDGPCICDFRTVIMINGCQCGGR